MKKDIISIMGWAFCVGGLFLGSCTKMDHFYKDYVIERNYTGKPDSIWIQPGDQRVQIGLFRPKDAEARNLVIHWNETDSLVVPIDRNLEKQLVIIDDLEERGYVFDIYTTDGQGKRSLPMELSTTVYGDEYRSTIRDRNLSHSVVFTDSIALLWNTGQSETLYGVEIAYTDKSGDEQTVLSPASTLVSIVQDADPTKPVSVRSVYRPNVNAFDYFYTDPVAVDLVSTKRNTLTFTSDGYEDAAYVDFNLVRTFGQDDVPKPTGGVLDICYALGAGSRGNIFTMNSPSFSAFASNWQALINSWTFQNEGQLKLDRSASVVGIYDALDETNRNQMIEAFENSTAAVNTRISSLVAGDIIFFHSVARDLYVAMRVLSTPPATSGALGDFEVEFKISRP